MVFLSCAEGTQVTGPSELTGSLFLNSKFRSENKDDGPGRRPGEPHHPSERGRAIRATDYALGDKNTMANVTGLDPAICENNAFSRALRGTPS